MFRITGVAVLSVIAVLFAATGCCWADGASKVICSYDSRSYIREGLGKVTFPDLDPAMELCTHLVYRSAGLTADTHRVTSLNPSLDLDQGKGHFRIITTLKRRFPTLKIILSVGGGHDEGTEDHPAHEKYLTMLESSASRIAFINSAYELVKTYQFDGIDLAWQFPENRPKKIKGTFGSFWSSVKSTVGITKGPIDEKMDEHREEFTALVRELKNAFRHDNYIISLTLNPNVNSTNFYDIPAVINNVDYVTLPSYDFQTPARNPKEADFPAPINALNERIPESNVDFQVQYWIRANAPASKLIVAIPTFGRTWRLETDATSTGVPPILGVSEPGAEGPQSKQAGLLSYPEICSKLQNANNAGLKGADAPMRLVNDPRKSAGTYAYRLPDADGNFGLWVAYDGTDIAAAKAAYVRSKGLGGVAIVDLTYDDFRGTCSGVKFPILLAAKHRL